jgi:hypothetical protein
MLLVDCNVKVEWVELGEGFGLRSIDLCRFVISKWEYGNWREVDDGSQLVNVPTDAEDEIKLALLYFIMGEVKDLVESGESIKKACEILSWITPESLFK